jgi:hypothetical protein
VNHFDDDLDSEPVAVVRVFGDFAMTLSVTLMLLISARSATQSDQTLKSNPAAPQSNAAPSADLWIAVSPSGLFSSPGERKVEMMDAASFAKKWFYENKNPPKAVMVQFPSRMEAINLHNALLQLQLSIGPNVSIRTYPEP